MVFVNKQAINQWLTPFVASRWRFLRRTAAATGAAAFGSGRHRWSAASALRLRRVRHHHRRLLLLNKSPLLLLLGATVAAHWRRSIWKKIKKVQTRIHTFAYTFNQIQNTNIWLCRVSILQNARLSEILLGKFITTFLSFYHHFLIDFIATFLSFNQHFLIVYRHFLIILSSPHFLIILSTTKVVYRRFRSLTQY